MDMREITKRFPGVLANDSVDLTINKGEIHALLGENGAGKSTLMNVLAGLYLPEQGHVLVHGRPVHIDSPKTAFDLGIAMVHQHFKLVMNQSVAENIILGLLRACRERPIQTVAAGYAAGAAAHCRGERAV